MPFAPNLLLDLQVRGFAGSALTTCHNDALAGYTTRTHIDTTVDN